MSFKRTKSFACKTLARPRYCVAINSISAVCASSRSVFYVIGNCIAISYYIIKPHIREISRMQGEKSAVPPALLLMQSLNRLHYHLTRDHVSPTAISQIQNTTAWQSSSCIPTNRFSLQLESVIRINAHCEVLTIPHSLEALFILLVFVIAIYQ